MRRLTRARAKAGAEEEEEDEEDEDEEDEDEDEGSSSAGSESSSSDSEEEEEEEGDLEKRMFRAVQSKDFDAMIDVIEEDEARVCERNGVKLAKRQRSAKQTSHMVNYEDPYGKTPLHLACELGMQRVVLGLLLRGADANLESKLGLTPLMTAAKFGNARACAVLLDGSLGHVPARVAHRSKKDRTVWDEINPKSRSKIEPILREAHLKQGKGLRAMARSKARQRRATAVAAKREAGKIDSEEAEALLLSSSSDSGNEAGEEEAVEAVAGGRPRGRGSLARAAARFNPMGAPGGAAVRKPTRRRTLAQRLTSLARSERPRQEAAARTIQAQARVFLARRRMQRMVAEALEADRRLRKMVRYAKKIQQRFRGSRARRLARRLLRERRAAVKIQAQFRGFLERRDKERLLAGRRVRDLAWREAAQHRGWMGRFAQRASQAVWEAAARRASGVLTRHARGKLARKRVALIRAQRAAAVVIQAATRGALARHPARVVLRRHVAGGPSARAALRARLDSIRELCAQLELGREVRAARIIVRALRPRARVAASNAIGRNLDEAATTIQRAARGRLGRKVARALEARRIKQLGLVADCLSVRGVVPAKNRGGLGDPAMYGYCAKCEQCRFFRAMEIGGRPEPHICQCGHHLVNHAVGAFRSSHRDYFGRVKIKPLRHRFWSRVGPMSDLALEEARHAVDRAALMAPKASLLGAIAPETTPSVRRADRLPVEVQAAKARAEQRAAAFRDRREAAAAAAVEAEWREAAALAGQRRQLLSELKLRQAEQRHLELMQRQKLELKRAVTRRLERMRDARIRDTAEKRAKLRAISRPAQPRPEQPRPMALPQISSPKPSQPQPQPQQPQPQQQEASAPETATAPATTSPRPSLAPEAPPTPSSSLPNNAQSNASAQTDPQEQQLITAIDALNAKLVHAALQRPAPARQAESPGLWLELKAAQHVAGERLPARIPLDRTPIVIGRGATADVRVDSRLHPRMVSKTHCVLHVDQRRGCVEVVDLRSTNGTLVDGKRLAPRERRPLDSGASLTLGGAAVAVGVSSEVVYRLQPARRSTT